MRPVVFDIFHIYFQAVVDFVFFAGHLILRKHQPLDLSFTQFHIYVLRVDLAHDATHQLVFFVGELAQSVVAFGFVQFLQNDLFRGLRRDPAEIFRNELFIHFVAQFITLFDQLRLGERNFFFLILHFGNGCFDGIKFDGALFGIEFYFHDARAALVLFFICGGERVLQRFDKHAFAYPLFRFQVRQSQKEILVNHCVLLDLFSMLFEIDSLRNFRYLI